MRSVAGCRRLIQVTPQEEQLLNSLVERVNQTQLQEKDPDAEALLNRAFGTNPDALYILAQTVLVQNIALEQAKAQLAQLQAQQAQLQQSQQPARATSFLGNLLGHHDPAPPPQQPAYVPPPPPPAYMQPQYQQPQYAPVASGPPSFMRGAMQTAAGVAAGALAFEGVEAVLHGLGGFGHSGMGWGGPGMGMGMGGFGMGPGAGMMGAGFERPVEETVVNNYYDQPAGGHEGIGQGGFAPGGEEHHFHESADQFSNQGGAQLTDASYNTADDNQGSYDDSNSTVDDSGGFDNSGQNDSSGFDGGGGFDDGGGGGGGDLL
jgi:hypothetical protein